MFRFENSIFFDIFRHFFSPLCVVTYVIGKAFLLPTTRRKLLCNARQQLLLGPESFHLIFRSLVSHDYNHD
jgi:hypothetical protein